MKVVSVPEAATDMYDVVVVGGGSAGAVVAARLAEDPTVKVLLVEAGGYADEMDAHMPVACAKMQHSKRDWEFYTEPDGKNAFIGLDGKRSFWPRGKCLGGSSVLNYMAYVRGARQDFDTWAAMGATGWSFDEVLPYFMKSEDMETPDRPDAPIEHRVHGTGGPLSVSVTLPKKPLAEAFVQAAESLGFRRSDYNNGDMDGVAGLFQQTIRRGSRCDTCKAFLATPAPKPNLTIATFGHVTNVILGEEPLRARGIQVCDTREGVRRTSYRVWAQKQVVVCGGAIGSPHLLMLSGIGPREVLERAGVPCVVDLPVGKDLEDHFAMMVPFKAAKPDIGAINKNKVEGPLVIGPNLLRWSVMGTGIMASPGYDATLFYKTPEFAREEPNMGPDAQIGISCTPGDAQMIETNLGLAPEHNYIKGHYEPDSQGFGMVPTLLHPHSRGAVELVSANPFEHPKITCNFYTDDRDLKAMVGMLRKCFELARSPALAAFAGEPLLPPDLLKRYGGSHESQELLEEYVRLYSSTLYHPTSTCKIGKVVDERLRVKGVEGLRVVDASIMPTVISGNTNAPCIMIGEKGADMIKQDLGLSSVQETKPPAKVSPLLGPAAVMAGIAGTFMLFTNRSRL